MMQPLLTDNLRIVKQRGLVPPVIIIEELPLTSSAAQTVIHARESIHRILHGQDDRLLVLVGPCSIHDQQAALEYGNKLLAVQKRFADALVLVMRVYFEKPRTTVGWKGFINDPSLDDSFQINKGLRLARELLLALNDKGLPCGTEFLDVITPQYFSDLISWGAIGARTTESQVHRELASGLSMPVGFKNGTDGNVQISIDAIKAARASHHFLSVTKQGHTAIFTTRGNEDTHVILRGGKDHPNFDATSLQQAQALLEKAGLPSRLMIDCSHGNSSKDYRRQPLVAQYLAEQIRMGAHHIMGLMIESHLLEGTQPITQKPLVYGRSITDACISWEMTLPILETLSDAVLTRRKKIKK